MPAWGFSFQRNNRQPAPYMSFAPKLKRGVEKQYPAIAHYDGSARPQTVTREAGQAARGGHSHPGGWLSSGGGAVKSGR